MTKKVRLSWPTGRWQGIKEVCCVVDREMPVTKPLTGSLGRQMGQIGTRYRESENDNKEKEKKVLVDIFRSFFSLRKIGRKKKD